MLWQARQGFISGRGALDPAASTTPPTLSFVAQASFPSGSGSTTRTYSGASIGNPTYIATRRVICVVRNFSTSVTLSSATIAGVAAAIDTQQSNGIDCVAIISAVVTSGTTGDVVLTTSGNDFNNVRLEVYTVDNSLLSSATPVVGFTTGAAEASNTATVATLSGGFVIVAWTTNGGGTSPSVTASTDTVTQDATGPGLWCGHANSVTVSASWSATISWTTNSTRDTIVVAAYR